MLVLNIVLSYLKMDLNLTNFTESNPGQPKNFFPFLCFITAADKKLSHHWLFLLLFTKTGKFLWSLSPLDSKYLDSSPDSYAIRRLFMLDLLLKCKRLL